MLKASVLLLFREKLLGNFPKTSFLGNSWIAGARLSSLEDLKRYVFFFYLIVCLSILAFVCVCGTGMHVSSVIILSVQHKKVGFVRRGGKVFCLVLFFVCLLGGWGGGGVM